MAKKSRPVPEKKSTPEDPKKNVPPIVQGGPLLGGFTLRGIWLRPIRREYIAGRLVMRKNQEVQSGGATFQVENHYLGQIGD